jgi:hypothetical protein
MLWTSKSLRKLTEGLGRMGHTIGRTFVRPILHHPASPESDNLQGALGYFSGRSFQSADGTYTTDEIALNPQHFAKRGARWT